MSGWSEYTLMLHEMNALRICSGIHPALMKREDINCLEKEKKSLFKAANMMISIFEPNLYLILITQQEEVC